MFLSYNQWIRKIRRSFTEASTRQQFAILGTIVSILWVSGLLDRIREERYEDFRWPTDLDQHHESTKFSTFPKCRFTENDVFKMMIIVKSSAKNVAMRESVRRTWGTYRKVQGFEVMPVFIVGRVQNLEVMRRIDREIEQYKDILAIPAIDSYRNNTFKLFGALDYAASPHDCSTPDFVFLVDDDYVVHIPNLVELAKTKKASDEIYEGFVFDTSPFRLKLHKHCISLDEYPFSRYPPYVSAGAVFIDSGTVKKFQKTMRSLKMFPFDDVFTGILAKTIGISASHNENFVFWSRQVTATEWKDGVIAVHGFARSDLENEYKKLFG